MDRKRLHANDEIQENIEEILKFLQSGNRDTMRELLKHFDIVSIYRMTKIDSRFRNLSQDIWKNYLITKTGTTTEYESAINPVLMEYTAFGASAKPMNWLWAVLTWKIVSTLESAFQPTSVEMKRLQTFPRKPVTRRVFLLMPQNVGRNTPTRISKKDIYNWLVVVSIDAWNKDNSSIHIAFKGLNIVDKAIDRYIKQHIYKWYGQPIGDYDIGSTHSGLRLDAQFDKQRMIRIFYAMLEGGLVYLHEKNDGTYDGNSTIRSEMQSIV